ncbi:signal peptidase [Alkanindiges hydrocarboniclasticus]|uniref:Signal peptidase n=1 Tax=Alkanindiges hydrocarboniclasticus TaxID=1907941 RepID=A0A1S8CS22_9GAMM|nr:DUF2147 domain-containing protein [Alkanindiges hydrocarboniclasticus]ONG37755.1 signal peptidase [Alkanindiges hydrocarboniclasticus]
MKAMIAAVLLSLSASMSYASEANIEGVWRTVDDKTGYALAHISIEKQANDTYIGTIIEQFPFPGQPLILLCQKCPKPYTDQPIKNLQVFKGLINDVKQPDNYKHGKIIDPLTGKIYGMKAKLSSNGKKLRIRGYIGTSVIGRSQTWLRKE